MCVCVSFFLFNQFSLINLQCKFCILIACSFLSFSHTGCLSIQYITTGDAVARVSLYQQDKGNYCLWMSEPASHTSPDVPANYLMDFTVDLFRGSPRYFLELYIDKHRPGAKESVFALAHLRLAYRPCFKDNANHCRPVPKQNDPEIVMP